MSVAELVNEVIVHAAATSFIHMQIFAVNQTNQSERNTRCFKGVSQPSGVGVE
jgi:hypothetical protein